jgi:ubiquinone/menaquinone biosynthesis C-methylase UbiE
MKGPIRAQLRCPIFEAMGFYSKHVFPRILEWGLGTPYIRELRSRALCAVRGRVLEMGFGTGLNLPHYPANVEELTIIDSEQMLPERVRERIVRSGLKVERIRLDAAALPFEDNHFDFVVTTFTLCSIREAGKALKGVSRVLKPGGRYIFIEHGRSDDAATAKLQDRFNPIQKIIAAGCNINRPIDAMIRDAGLSIMELERFIMPDTPRPLGEMYVGTATSQSWLSSARQRFYPIPPNRTD